MLLQFTVENYRSVRGKVVLSMLAPEGMKRSPRYVQEVCGHPVLRCAAVYGANASGKSNLVRAFHALRLLGVSGTRSRTDKLPVVPFRLDVASVMEPTRFEVEFVADGVQYAYGIALTREQVVEEWLYRVEGATDVMLFEREAPPEGHGEHIARVGDAVTQDVERRQFLRFVAKSTRPNQPLLAEWPERNVNEFDAVTRWFDDGCAVILPDSKYIPLVRRLQDESMRGFVEQQLSAWGTGVERLTLTTEPLEGFDTLDAEARAMVSRHIELHGVLPFLVHDEPSLARKENDAIVHQRLRFTHGTSQEGFAWEDESDGTRRLMHLLPVLWDASHDPRRRVFVVDELERSLHATLTRRFVECFLGEGQRLGQLVFTTHDTNLLKGSLLPPACVWLTEKALDGATHLYTLTDFPPDQLVRLPDLEEGYLQGRFGAIPFPGARRLPVEASPKEPGR